MSANTQEVGNVFIKQEPGLDMTASKEQDLHRTQPHLSHEPLPQIVKIEHLLPIRNLFNPNLTTWTFSLDKINSLTGRDISDALIGLTQAIVANPNSTKSSRRTKKRALTKLANHTAEGKPSQTRLQMNLGDPAFDFFGRVLKVKHKGQSFWLEGEAAGQGIFKRSRMTPEELAEHQWWMDAMLNPENTPKVWFVQLLPGKEIPGWLKARGDYRVMDANTLKGRQYMFNRCITSRRMNTITRRTNALHAELEQKEAALAESNAAIERADAEIQIIQNQLDQVNAKIRELRGV